MRSCSRTFPSSDYAPTELPVRPWRKGRRLTAHLLRIAGWLVCSYALRTPSLHLLGGGGDHDGVVTLGLARGRKFLGAASVRTVADDSPGFRRSRLWLEATLRKSPVAITDPTLTAALGGLSDPLDYQGSDRHPQRQQGIAQPNRRQQPPSACLTRSQFICSQS